MAQLCKPYPAGVGAMLKERTTFGNGTLRGCLVLTGGIYNPADATLSSVINGGALDALVGGSDGVRKNFTPTQSIVGNRVRIHIETHTWTAVDALQSIEALVVVVNLAAADGDAPFVWMSGGDDPYDLPQVSQGGNLTITPHADGIFEIQIPA